MDFHLKFNIGTYRLPPVFQVDHALHQLISLETCEMLRDEVWPIYQCLGQY